MDNMWTTPDPMTPPVVPPPVQGEFAQGATSSSPVADAPELWRQALTVFQDTMPPGMFDAWIAQVRGVACEGGRFTIEVPNTWVQAGIRGRYAMAIEETLSRFAGGPVSLDVTVSHEPRERSSSTQSGNGHGGSGSSTDTPFAAPTAPPASIAGVDPPPIEIQLNPRYTFANFVVGRSNEFAHAACDAVAKRAPGLSYNPLFIYGGVGLGKSHLVQAIAHAILSGNPFARVFYLSAETWMNEMIASLQNGTILAFKEKFRSADFLLLDDIQFFSGKESTQEELFHTFNVLIDANKQIVLASDRPAHQIEDIEERLISRFQAGLVADIQSPDLETRLAILRKRAASEGIVMSADVSLVVASCAKQNVRELEGSLTRLLAFASLTGREITPDLAKHVLKEYLSQPSRKVTIDRIQDVVIEYFSLPADSMRAKRRQASVAHPRQIAMFLAREMTGLSLAEIGKRFGGRDHSTVLHAIDKVRADSNRDPAIADALARLKRMIVEYVD